MVPRVDPDCRSSRREHSHRDFLGPAAAFGRRLVSGHSSADRPGMNHDDSCRAQDRSQEHNVRTMGLQGRQDLKDLQEELQEAQKALDDFREQLHRERHLREEISIELKERDENLHEVREALKKTRVELQEEKNLQDFMSQELQKRNEHLEKSQQPLEQQHEATVTTLKKRNEQLSRARNARDKWKKVAEEHIFADSQAVFERCLYQAGIIAAAHRRPTRPVANPADKYDLCLNNLFHEMSGDLVTVINTIVDAIDTVKKTGGDDTVLWRARAVTRLMFYVCRTIESMLLADRILVYEHKNGNLLLCDQKLDEALHSADLQLLRTLEEVIKTHPKYNYKCAFNDVSDTFTESDLAMTNNIPYLYRGARYVLPRMKAQSTAGH